MNITVKDVPPALHERLRAVAERSGRSLNKLILYTLEQSVSPRQANPVELLGRVRRRRSEMKLWLDDESLEAAIDEGRP